MEKCGKTTEIYSRVCGFIRPICDWNRGKKEEFKERKLYNIDSKSEQNTKTNYPKSEKEFIELKVSGMLWEFFPKSGDTFDSFKKSYPNFKYKN